MEQIVGAATTVVHAIHAPAPQRQIEGGTAPPEITGSADDQHGEDDEVVDGEVVEDHDDDTR